MKTNKSYKRRVKVTKNGKLIVRSKGQNHFNSRETGRQGIAKRRTSEIQMNSQAKRRFLSNVKTK